METENSLAALERLQREFQSVSTQTESLTPERDVSSESVPSNGSQQDLSRRRTKSKGSRVDGRRKKRSMSSTKLREPFLAIRAPNTSLESLDMIAKHLLLALSTENGVQIRKENTDIDLLFWTIDRLHRRFCMIETSSTALSESKEIEASNQTTKRLEHCARKLVLEIGVQHSASLAPGLLSACFLPKSLPRSLSGNQKHEAPSTSPREHMDHRKRSQSESHKKGPVTPANSDHVISNAVLSSLFKAQNGKAGVSSKPEPPRTASPESLPTKLQPAAAPSMPAMPALPNKPSLIIPLRAESEPAISREVRSTSPSADSKDSDYDRSLPTARPAALPGIIIPDSVKPEIVRRPFRRENSKNEGENTHQQISPPPLSSECSSTPPLPSGPLLSPSSSASSVSKPFKRRADMKADSSSGGSPAHNTDTSPSPIHRGPRRHLKRSSSDADRLEDVRDAKIVESIDWRSPTTARQPRRSELFEPVDYPSASGNNGYAYSLEERENPLGREQPTAFASSSDIRRLQYQFADDYEFGATGFDDDLEMDGGEDGNLSDASGSSLPNSARSDGPGDVLSDDGKDSQKVRRKKSKKKRTQPRYALPPDHLIVPSNTSSHCRFVFANLFSEFNCVFEQSTWETQIWPAFQRLDTFILSRIVYGAPSNDSTTSNASDSKNALVSPRGRASSSSNIIRAWSGPIVSSGSNDNLRVSTDSNGSKSSEKSKSPEKSRPISPKKEKSKKSVEPAPSSSNNQKISAGRMMAVSEWSWGVFWILFRRYCSYLLENASSQGDSYDSSDESSFSPRSGSKDSSKTSVSLPAPFDEDAFNHIQSILRYNVIVHQQAEKCYEWRAQYDLDFDTTSVPKDVLAAPKPKTSASPSPPNAALDSLASYLGMPLLTKDEAATRFHDYFFRTYLRQKPLGTSIAQRLAMLHSNKYEAELKLANVTKESAFGWNTSVDYDLVCLGSSYFSQSKSRSCTIL